MRINGRTACWPGVIALVTLLWAPSVPAIQWNGFTITPSISYTGEYDDNVFRTKDNKESDYINIITPGIQLEYKGRHELRAGYKVEILRYSDWNNLDTERHTAVLDGLFTFNRLQLRFGEEFRRTDDFPSTQLTQRIERNENTLGGGFDYDVARLWGVGFDARWGHVNYLEQGFDDLDRNSYTLAPSFYYRLTAKTRVFVEPNFAVEEFGSGENRDNYRYRALVGARGDFTERFSVTGKAGFEYLDFQENTTQDDFGTFVGEIEATYRPLERLQTALILRRNALASTHANNLEYEAFTGVFAVTYAFTSKLLFIPRVAIGVDNYREDATIDGETKQRLDVLYGAGIGVRYQIQRWLRVDANYDFSARDSNFDVFDYTDNRVWFSIVLSM
jgi:hypothetical protein